jgi:hypothetical protein
LGKGENLKIGKFEDWKIGRLENWSQSVKKREKREKKRS